MDKPKYRITKLSESANPEIKAGDSRTWKYGVENTESLPVDYYIEGWLLNSITVGQCVKALRDNRNGVKMPGYFITSPVTKITDTGFETLNSIYLVEKVANFS